MSKAQEKVVVGGIEADLRWSLIRQFRRRKHFTGISILLRGIFPEGSHWKRSVMHTQLHQPRQL